MAFLEYLHTAKTKISKPELFVHLVLGNESCDLDSMVSSLVYAFYLSKTPKYNNTLVIPVINKTRKLFPIKVENFYLLKKYSVPVDDLVYKDTINFKELQNNSKLSVTLVDHHVLPADWSFLKASVTEIIDHRPIDHSEVWDDAVDTNIQIVGSCCTLITTYVKDSEVTAESNVLGMLYDVITYDTIAYKPEAGKVQALDVEMAGFLTKTLNIEPGNCVALFDEIYDAHRNIQQLTTEQLLYKDLKVIGNIHIPGLPMLVEVYIKKSDVYKALDSYKQENNAEIILLMGLEVSDGKVTRDLAVYTRLQDEGDKLEKLLVEKFEAVKESGVSCENIRYFTQKNNTLSRKQLVGLLKVY